jgi:pimeloyl-ACP methyl ester carboxylesterase
VNRRRFLAAGSTLALAACAAPGVAPRPSSGIAEVNGTRLYYEVAGSGDPVVLCARSRSTPGCGRPVRAAGADFRVIRYDARGFGSRRRRSRRAVLERRRSRGAPQHLDARRPTSWDCRWAAVRADYAVTHPDGLRSLVVIDGVIGGWQWSREWVAVYAPIVEAGRRRDVARQVAVARASALRAARAQPEVGARLKQMVDDYSGWHFVNQNPERAVSPPALGRLGAIRAPTLVLVGERDLPDFHRMSERLERDIPGARRATIAGAGHMANMEAPEAVNKALGGFLNRG